MLGTLMSECSEVCWSAGWLSGTEKQLPPLVEEVLITKKPIKWGHGIIDYETAVTLGGLKNILGNWVTYSLDESNYIICPSES